MASADVLRVEVVYLPKDQPEDVVALELAPGSTVLHALRASGVLARHVGIDLATQRVGIWGRVMPLSQPLRDKDRVEIYRPLTVDPKEARRLRYRDHKERKAGR